MDEVGGYRVTWYFAFDAVRKRPYLTRELCIRVVECPDRVQVQSDGRVRFWAILDEFEGRALRVITLPDRKTIHNAFLDRRFKP
ncbi:MAG: hypothetical protein ABIS31_00875 [Candidatus Eisenbacteria bacterium]